MIQVAETKQEENNHPFYLSFHTTNTLSESHRPLRPRVRARPPKQVRKRAPLHAKQGPHDRDGGRVPRRGRAHGVGGGGQQGGAGGDGGQVVGQAGGQRDGRVLMKVRVGSKKG